jgi:hypothetical protein
VSWFTFGHADASDTECHRQERPGAAPARAVAPHVQQVHSSAPAVPQVRGRSWGSTVPRRPTVLSVVVLVVFFALLTLADVLPGQSGAPGLVAPLR